MELQEIIDKNIGIQNRAKELNIRAGKPIFPIMSYNEWTQWLTSRLNGATCTSEVNIMDIKLPELDQKIINKIIDENPDTIEVSGKQVPVVYKNNNPQIIIEDWNNLPDDGIKLPSGRQVEVKVIIENGWSSYSDTNIYNLKEKLTNYFNKKLWENWIRPEILPDITSGIPEIEIREYGKCISTGSSLLAYGTIIAYQYWSDDPITWKYEWYCERDKAEESRNKSIKKLNEIKSEEILKHKISEARMRAEDIKNDIKELYDKLSSDLRDKLYNFYYGYIPLDFDGINKWISDAKAIYNEVKSEEILKHKISEARIQAEDIKKDSKIENKKVLKASDVSMENLLIKFGPKRTNRKNR